MVRIHPPPPNIESGMGSGFCIGGFPGKSRLGSKAYSGMAVGLRLVEQFAGLASEVNDIRRKILRYCPG